MVQEYVQTRTGEETPLLRPAEAAPIRAGDDDTTSTVKHTDDDADCTARQSPRPVGWYVWRGVWTLLAALVLGIFIRGWIEAGGDVQFDFKDALKKALGSGISGAIAMVLQVLLLMPLRTMMNYQYRFGHSFTEAMQILYRERGLGRYYDGLGAALIQGPISRFGDTAANAGILALLQSNSYLKDLPSLIQTIFVSLCAASFRILLTPIDTVKTTLQTQGQRGTVLLRQRIKTNGIGSLWWGALATAAATFAGNYPWFATYNLLTDLLPEPAKHPLAVWLLRLALIGFVASAVSDSASNSLRVVKTYRQVNETSVSYCEFHTLSLSCLWPSFRGKEC
ncbi:hypothetical protein SEPCBS57363_006308 [Sporothrix epigloea]|uniref:Mitochondrial carrier protein n=1 Tax=Sporothrix epigloea TaxID=1892477 RepID=A0ABP0E5R4_9PEZI